MHESVCRTLNPLFSLSAGDTALTLYIASRAVIVQKFGGTSAGSGSRMVQICDIVKYVAASRIQETVAFRTDDSTLQV
jgi:hypothetical protein